MRNIYQEIIEEGNEILENGIGHLRHRTRTHMPIAPLKEYTPHEIKAIREKNQYSQTFFGDYLGISLKTMQAWENGTDKPTGAALRIFQILEQDPYALDKYLLTDA